MKASSDSRWSQESHQFGGAHESQRPWNDMISLPSHTSHELQPLDKAYFRPFKVAFRTYRVLWSIKNSGSKCRKENLTQWASLAPKKALIPQNITIGFRATRMWPLNPQAMTFEIGPNETFVNEDQEQEQREEILGGDLPSCEEGIVHYYGSELELDDEEIEKQNLEQSQSSTATKEDHISKFLKLPRTTKKTRRMGKAKPLIDYSQSQLLTLDEHLCNLKDIATKTERIQIEKEQKLKERELSKAKKAKEKELIKI